MSSDRKLLRIKASTFRARGSSGSLYEVECLANILEERDGARVVHTPKSPEFRLVDSRRAVNRNPIDDSYTVVGTGERLWPLEEDQSTVDLP